MSTFAITLTAVLGIVFLVVGTAKLAGAPALVSEFARLGLPSWFRLTTGIIEAAGAALLLAALLLDGDDLALAGSVLLVAVMIGAIATHLRNGDRADKLVPPIVLLGLLALEAALLA